MQTLTLSSTLPLLGGAKIPRLGLGVWQAPGKTAFQAVLAALDAGYRHIDTAMIYGNETEVGQAIKENGVRREEVFVTTKLWTADHGYDAALRAFDSSEKRLGLGFVDLYLSHFPVPGQRIPTWKALATLAKSGLCRAIGVSNYTVRHLKELIEATGVIPAVNQVEFHPYLFQKDLLEFCREYGIILTAYSPLTHGQRLNDPKLKALAGRYGKTPAQLLIRWGLQHDLVVIPKSSKRERIEENADVYSFAISEADMRQMNHWNEDLRTCWDPSEEP